MPPGHSPIRFMEAPVGDPLKSLPALDVGGHQEVHYDSGRGSDQSRHGHTGVIVPRLDPVAPHVGRMMLCCAAKHRILGCILPPNTNFSASLITMGEGGGAVLGA